MITCEIYVIACEIYVIACEIHVNICEIYVITCEIYVIACEIHTWRWNMFCLILYYNNICYVYFELHFLTLLFQKYLHFLDNDGG